MFNENYLIFFKNIYYKSEKSINLKKYGLENEIILPNDIKMFNDLLLDNIDENIDNEKYIGNIYLCAAQNYFEDDKFINKRSI